MTHTHSCFVDAAVDSQSMHSLQIHWRNFNFSLTFVISLVWWFHLSLSFAAHTPILFKIKSFAFKYTYHIELNMILCFSPFLLAKEESFEFFSFIIFRLQYCPLSEFIYLFFVTCRTTCETIAIVWFTGKHGTPISLHTWPAIQYSRYIITTILNQTKQKKKRKEFDQWFLFATKIVWRMTHAQ